MRDAYCVIGRIAKYDIRNTHDELSYLPALEEGDG